MLDFEIYSEIIESYDRESLSESDFSPISDQEIIDYKSKVKDLYRLYNWEVSERKRLKIADWSFAEELLDEGWANDEIFSMLQSLKDNPNLNVDDNNLTEDKNLDYNISVNKELKKVKNNFESSSQYKNYLSQKQLIEEFFLRKIVATNVLIDSGISEQIGVAQDILVSLFEIAKSVFLDELNQLASGSYPGKVAFKHLFFIDFYELMIYVIDQNLLRVFRLNPEYSNLPILNDLVFIKSKGIKLAKFNCDLYESEENLKDVASYDYPRDRFNDDGAFSKGEEKIKNSYNHKWQDVFINSCLLNSYFLKEELEYPYKDNFEQMETRKERSRHYEVVFMFLKEFLNQKTSDSMFAIDNKNSESNTGILEIMRKHEESYHIHHPSFIFYYCLALILNGERYKALSYTSNALKSIKRESEFEFFDDECKKYVKAVELLTSQVDNITFENYQDVIEEQLLLNRPSLFNYIWGKKSFSEKTFESLNFPATNPKRIDMVLDLDFTSTFKYINLSERYQNERTTVFDADTKKKLDFANTVYVGGEFEGVKIEKNIEKAAELYECIFKVYSTEPFLWRESRLNREAKGEVTNHENSNVNNDQIISILTRVVLFCKATERLDKLNELASYGAPDLIANIRETFADAFFSGGLFGTEIIDKNLKFSIDIFTSFSDNEWSCIGEEKRISILNKSFKYLTKHSFTSKKMDWVVTKLVEIKEFDYGKLLKTINFPMNYEGFVESYLLDQCVQGNKSDYAYLLNGEDAYLCESDVDMAFAPPSPPNLNAKTNFQNATNNCYSSMSAALGKREDPLEAYKAIQLYAHLLLWESNNKFGDVLNGIYNFIKHPKNIFHRHPNIIDKRNAKFIEGYKKTNPPALDLFQEVLRGVNKTKKGHENFNIDGYAGVCQLELKRKLEDNFEYYLELATDKSIKIPEALYLRAILYVYNVKGLSNEDNKGDTTQRQLLKNLSGSGLFSNNEIGFKLFGFGSRDAHYRNDYSASSSNKDVDLIAKFTNASKEYSRFSPEKAISCLDIILEQNSHREFFYSCKGGIISKSLELKSILISYMAERVGEERMEAALLANLTHTLNNALPVAPIQLKKAIRVIENNDSSESLKRKTINGLHSQISMIQTVSQLIDNFKYITADRFGFSNQWKFDKSEEVGVNDVILVSIKQCLGRALFTSDGHFAESVMSINEKEGIKVAKSEFSTILVDSNEKSSLKNTIGCWIDSFAKNIKLTLAGDIICFGRNKLKSSFLFAIFSEVIWNAIKHNRVDGELHISCRLLDESYHFEVINSIDTKRNDISISTKKGLKYIETLLSVFNDKNIYFKAKEETKNKFKVTIHLPFSLF